MFSIIYIRKNEFIFAALACVSAALGDTIEERLERGWSLALVDNVAHFLVACFTWASVSSSSSGLIFKSGKWLFLCGAIASLIDLDHFLAAHSWRLEDATALKSRPPLHNTSIIILFTVVCLCASQITSFSWLWTFGWIFMAAGISHHIRDASRRGFWIWPFGSTPPVPYFLYIILLFLFPIFLSVIIGSSIRHKSPDYFIDV